MDFIAHSRNDKIEPQLYSTHIYNGLQKANELIEELRFFLSSDDYRRIKSLVLGAYKVHDLGKLCKYSQKILHHQQIGKMPNHVDAGVAYLLNTKQKDDVLKAFIVKSHHWGYDDFPKKTFNYVAMRDENYLKDRCPWITSSLIKMNEYTDSILEDLTNLQHELVQSSAPSFDIKNPIEETALFMRLALSILVTADHYDTAKNYQNFVVEKNIPIQAEKRLEKLDRYVKGLGKVPDPLKDKIYNACRNSQIEDRLVQCKSEVATGKTTALMAYALQQCVKNNMRRIIYVAPFTNIITQTVNVYRKAIVLDGENKLEVVAEHHHQVDFLADLQDQKREDIDLNEERYALKTKTTNWHSPIVCTTAVQFFETLGSTGTSKLKKMQHLPGSVIIIDESHTSIPNALWPLTLIWLKELTKRFGCIVVFASGSMICPWDVPIVKDEINKFYPSIQFNIPSIIPIELSKETLGNEKKRVPIFFKEDPFADAVSICNWVTSPEFDGPKILVCNTIVNAALIANQIKKQNGNTYVYHLSTSLTPLDREKTLELVKTRLKNKNDNWILVATSCVEAGVDISFKHGFRENSNLMNVMQLSGRVSRKAEYPDCSLTVFNLDLENSLFTSNPAYSFSKTIFRKLYQKYKLDLGPEYCEEAFEKEIQRGILPLSHRFDPLANKLDIEDLLKAEKDLKFETIKNYYAIISGNKKTVIVNEFLLSTDPSITEILKHSVQIYDSKIAKLPISPSKKFQDFLVWDGKYDDFLGYQAELMI